MEVTLGPFTFSSKFECGNLAKVVTAGSEESTVDVSSSPTTTKPKKSLAGGMSNLPPGPVDYDFNMWTQPDCAGTEYENNNRTWFCFSIQGGVPGQRVKLNIMNLNRQMKLFSQGMLPVFQTSNNNVPHSKWERIKDKCNYRAEDGCTIISWMHNVPSESIWTFYAFTYPYLYSEVQTLLENVGQVCGISKSGIYYHRDVLIKSLDGNKLDMVTITSEKGRQEQREDSLPSLFPDWSSSRCHTFHDKKFIVMSARVHPGETSSSFVMKGFINFIVSEDPRAVRLRDMFVFKLIPMINPDGVIRGHYRSDQKGINLNRVYDKPSLQLHPTIYAIRQIIQYYHYGANLSLYLDAHSKEQETSAEKDSFRAPVLDEDACHSFSDAAGKKTITSISQSHLKPSSMETDEPSASGWDVSSNVSTESFAISSNQPRLNYSDVHDDCSNISGMSEHETGVTNMFNSLSPLRDFNSMDVVPQTSSPRVTRLSSPHLSSTPRMGSFFLGRGAHFKSKFDIAQSKDRNSKSKSSYDDYSSLFLYVDLHGHASKRGIFIFGNWFPNAKTMVENMLFPKLLSLNCQNFDFTACNFSEKNMYGKDRKDGTTKEGSGRVAVMKATGLVRSYTLECNYNTGRTCNLLPASPMSNRKTPPVVGSPPKYTPYVFEDCGRQLGVSLLDLMDCNDWSRVPQSQFGSLDGVRSYLHQMVSSSNSPRGNLPSQPPMSGTGGPSSSEPVSQSSPSTSSTNVTVKTSPPKPKVTRTKAKQRGRSRSWSLSVDAENLEPPNERRRPSSGKNMLTTAESKSKTRTRLKSASPKKPVSRALTFTDLESSSRYPCVDKFTDAHSLSSSVTITPTLEVELTVPEKNLPKKKLQKPLKQRRKCGSIASKKLKTTPSSATSEADLYKMADDMVALSANPLSPRSPLASVCEPQTSQSTSKLSKTKTTKKKVFPSPSKSIGKSEKKSLTKSIDKLPNVSMTHKVKILQRKSKKIEEHAPSSSGDPPEEPLDWFIQQTFPKSKKIKKGKTRKQL